MRKKWIVILVAAFVGIFALVWFVGVQNASKISFGKDANTASIAKKVKTTPDAEWILDPEIPSNYVPVPGETDLYMVLNEDGSVKEYRRRTKQADGSYTWETIENPTGVEYQKIKETEYGDVYKLTDGEFESFKRYIVDENNGFAWVDTDENGLPLNLPEGSDIPDYYKPVNDNTYAVYNDNGVLESYLKRLVDDNGNYQWSLVGRPEMLAYTSFDRDDPQTSQDDVSQSINNNFTFDDLSLDNEVWSASGDKKTSTYTYDEPPKEVDGFLIYYRTVITRVEDKDGNLLETKKESYETGRTPKAEVNNNDNGTMASSLGGEAQRVGSGIQWNTELEVQLFDLINAERIKAGKTAFPGWASDANMGYIAVIKAADMALTGTTTKASAAYGTVDQLAGKFGVSANFVEAVLETPPTDANTIHTKFLTDSNLRDCMKNASEIMIKAAQNNGRYYVYLLFKK